MIGNGSGAPHPAALAVKLAGNQLRWHYFFAHMALRKQVMRVPDLLEGALAEPERLRGWIRAALEDTEGMWGLTREQTTALAQTIAAGRAAIGDRQAVIVAMPPPREPTECYFVAIFRDTDGSIAYYTLERSVLVPTVLCGWTSDGAHSNYGASPEPTVEAFVQAIAEARKRWAPDPELNPELLDMDTLLDRLLAKDRG